MKIRVELKTEVSNDEFHRIPDVEKIQKAIETYSVGFKGAVVLHKSLYEYRYDTRNMSYNDVDTRNIIGHIQSTEISENKLFLIIEVDDTFLQDAKYICFFRSRMETTPGANTPKFNEIDIFAVDLTMVGDSEEVKERYLSEVTILSD